MAVSPPSILTGCVTPKTFQDVYQNLVIKACYNSVLHRQKKIILKEVCDEIERPLLLHRGSFSREKISAIN